RDRRAAKALPPSTGALRSIALRGARSDSRHSHFLFLVLPSPGIQTMTTAAMISFTCAGCGRPFTVPKTFAGRRATDAAQVPAALANSDYIKATPAGGDPPETYRIEYRIRGLDRGKNGQPIPPHPTQEKTQS